MSFWVWEVSEELQIVYLLPWLNCISGELAQWIPSGFLLELGMETKGYMGRMLEEKISVISWRWGGEREGVSRSATELISHTCPHIKLIKSYLSNLLS